MGTNGNQKSTGKRARTRELFAKAFKTKGVPNLTRYLKIYRMGDIVDIKADPSIQSGMPYKCYHGKTGRVFNVTPRAVGVYLNKKVGHRFVLKKMHIRTEHVQHSTSRDDFLARVKSNDAAKAAAKAAGCAYRIYCRLFPRGARGGVIAALVAFAAARATALLLLLLLLSLSLAAADRRCCWLRSAHPEDQAVGKGIRPSPLCVHSWQRGGAGDTGDVRVHAINLPVIQHDVVVLAGGRPAARVAPGGNLWL
eukprot:COSAG01_NODE_537_length_15764_cov_54.273795_14_plen_252_part_00